MPSSCSYLGQTGSGYSWNMTEVPLFCVKERAWFFCQHVMLTPDTWNLPCISVTSHINHVKNPWMLDLFFSHFHMKPSQVSRESQDVMFGVFPEGINKRRLIQAQPFVSVLWPHAIGTTAAVTVVGLREGSCLTWPPVFWRRSFVTRVYLDGGRRRRNLDRIRLMWTMPPAPDKDKKCYDDQTLQERFSKWMCFPRHVHFSSCALELVMSVWLFLLILLIWSVCSDVTWHQVLPFEIKASDLFPPKVRTCLNAVGLSQ